MHKTSAIADFLHITNCVQKPPYSTLSNGFRLSNAVCLGQVLAFILPLHSSCWEKYQNVISDALARAMAALIAHHTGFVQ